MSAGPLPWRRSPRPPCAAISTLLRVCAWNSLQPPPLPPRHLLPRSRCRRTKSIEHGVVHLDQAGCHTPRPARPRRKRRNPHNKSRWSPNTPCLGPVNAKCEKTPTSSALLLWRWLCGGKASWTTNGQAELAGRFHRGKRVQALTLSGRMEYPLDGSPPPMIEGPFAILRSIFWEDLQCGPESELGAPRREREYVIAPSPGPRRPGPSRPVRPKVLDYQPRRERHPGTRVIWLFWV